MYAPQLGGFISRDPIGYDGGINLYDYVAGNPVRHNDPLGLTPRECVLVPGSRTYDKWVFYTETAGTKLVNSGAGNAGVNANVDLYSVKAWFCASFGIYFSAVTPATQSIGGGVTLESKSGTSNRLGLALVKPFWERVLPSRSEFLRRMVPWGSPRSNDTCYCGYIPAKLALP